jgi:hypothetical protein
MLDDGQAFDEGLDAQYELRRSHRLRTFRIRIEALDENGSWKDGTKEFEPSELIEDGESV